MSKCRTCREGEMVTKSETYRYDECGLENVVLLDIPVRRCGNCGAHEALIPAVAKLHQLIAHDLISKESKLVGTEIRFLRKYLGWSGVDFAAYMGVGASVVSNWETDKDPIGTANDRLLRLMVAHGAQVQDYELADLKKIDDRKLPQRDMKLRSKSKSWLVEAR